MLCIATFKYSLQKLSETLKVPVTITLSDDIWFFYVFFTQNSQFMPITNICQLESTCLFYALSQWPVFGLLIYCLFIMSWLIWSNSLTEYISKGNQRIPSFDNTFCHDMLVPSYLGSWQIVSLRFLCPEFRYHFTPLSINQSPTGCLRHVWFLLVGGLLARFDVRVSHHVAPARITSQVVYSVFGCCWR